MRLVVRAALVLGALAALPAPAAANGRLPGMAELKFHPTDDDRFLIGSTLGLLVSDDGLATLRWVCEAAVGYGGMYDPTYSFHPSRDEIWSTTYDGLRVSRDGGCTWTSIDGPFAEYGDPPRRPFIADVAIGGDGRLWVTTASGDKANDVYVSTDGVDFTATAIDPDPKIWWESVKVAPGSPQVAWASGYRSFTQDGPPEAGFLMKTVDGGASWDAMSQTGIVFGDDPRTMILGFSPVDPDVVFIRVINAEAPLADAIYRTTDGGTSWTRVLQLASSLRGFAVSPDGQTVFAGTLKLCADDEATLPDGGVVQKGCLWKSTDGGATFAKAGYHPRMGADPTSLTSNALAFGPDGALYAGGSNPIDGFILGRSTDGGDSFARVKALPDIEGPLSCPSGTAQADCEALVWPSFCIQNFICPTSVPDAGAVDDGGDGGGGGCCAVAPRPAEIVWGLLLAAAVGALIVRPRRRR
jgi:hypothetical protein